MLSRTKRENVSVYLNPEDKSFSLKKGVLPSPEDNEVLLAVKCTGVCATDVHFWQWGEIGSYKVTSPTILGHESCGEVTEVGRFVRKLKKGDRVAIEPSRPCYACDLCLKGRYNLCSELSVLGLPPCNGFYTRYLVHDANFCHRLPENITDEEGAMVEPLSVAVHACRRAKVSIGDHVLVCGAGPIGLLTMMAAKAMGAVKVLITDVRQDRLNFAKMLKADFTLLVGEKPARQTADDIHLSLGQAPQITLDCCGNEESLRTSIMATKSGGVVVVVGLGRSEMKMPIVEASIREIDIRGTFMYPNCYQRSISMIAGNIIDVKPLITHRFKLADLSEAFQVVVDGKEGTIKVMVKCQE